MESFSAYSHTYVLIRRKAMTNLTYKKQRHYFANKGPSSQSYGFSSSLGHTQKTGRLSEDGGRHCSHAAIRNADGHLKPEEAKDSPLESLEGAWPCQCLDFEPLGPQTVREQVSVKSSSL